MSVKAKTPVSQSANILAVEIAVDPANLPIGSLLDNANWTLCGVAGAIDHAELHDRAASSSDWNWPASAPWTKKLFRSWPSGSETRRAVMPRSRSLCERHCAAC